MGVRAKGAILSPAVVAKEATEALTGPTLPFVFSGEVFFYPNPFQRKEE